MCRGTCSMARSQNPNSANSQFLHLLHRRPLAQQAVFRLGQVIEGMDNVDKIKRGEPVVDPDEIISMKVAADIAA